jgi:hypothetical protein
VLPGVVAGGVDAGAVVAGAVFTAGDVPAAGVDGVDGTVAVGALTVPLAEPDTPGVAGVCGLPGAALVPGGAVLVWPVAPTLPVLLIPGVPVGAPGLLTPGVMLLPIAVPLTTNSTRRFICRPAAVAFVATGFC